jgi:hypothetical protein
MDIRITSVVAGGILLGILCGYGFESISVGRYMRANDATFSAVVNNASALPPLAWLWGTVRSVDGSDYEMVADIVSPYQADESAPLRISMKGITEVSSTPLSRIKSGDKINLVLWRGSGPLRAEAVYVQS